MSRLGFLTSDTFRSLDNRNFRLFFVGQLISQIGNWSTLTIQTILVLRLTGSGVAVGLLAAAQFGPVLLFGPWAGLVADRSDKRRLLLIVQSLAMVQSFALAALGFMEQPPLAAIYLVAIAGGFATAFDNPTRRAFVVEMVPETEINNAVSLNSALMTGSRVIGPALGGALVLTLGFGWAFLFDGISYVAVLAGLLMMNVDRLRPSPAAKRGKGQVREGLRYVRGVPDLWVSLTMMAVVGTLAFNFPTTLPLFATRDLEGSETTYTLLLSTLSLGSFLGALVAARRKRIDLRVVSASALAFGATMGALAVMPTAGLAFPVGFLVGLTSIAFMTASTAIVQIRAEPMMRGRVLALQAMVFLGSTPIGGPIVGAICETVGARWALALGAVGTVGTGAAGWVYADRNPGPEAPPQNAAAVRRAGPFRASGRNPGGRAPSRAGTPTGTRRLRAPVARPQRPAAPAPPTRTPRVPDERPRTTRSQWRRPHPAAPARTPGRPARRAPPARAPPTRTPRAPGERPPTARARRLRVPRPAPASARRVRAARAERLAAATPDPTAGGASRARAAPRMIRTLAPLRYATGP